jgi:hypothetical protein
VLQYGYNAATGKLIEVRPATVVEDSERALVLYFAAGSSYLNGDFMLGRARYERTLEERVAVFLDPAPLDYEEREVRRHVVSILPPGAMHAVWYFWDRAWQPTECFVNLQAPYERRGQEIAITDYYLDIAMTADLSWRWKDVDEFEAMCQHGAFDATRREATWEEARRVAASIDAREWPFSEPWPRQLIDEAWPVPRIGSFGLTLGTAGT